MNCAKCGVELTPVFPDLRRRRDDWKFQLNNAIVIEAHGGYGMLIDPITKSDPQAVLCHDCGHQFAADNPWLGLDAMRGHMHEGTDFGEKGHGHE
jgi:hypothetical protein